MPLSSVAKKRWLSNAILLSFFILVTTAAILSNILKIPPKSTKELIEQVKVFNHDELKNITQISLKNKSGEYIFEREISSPNSSWHMTAPQNIPTNSIFIEKLFASLKIIKTKKFLNDDKANNANFSLVNPTAVITLANSSSNNKIILSIGIMNTIDNSTYLKISNKKGIYHAEAPSSSLENVTLTDLVESSIFNFDFKALAGIKISKNNLSSSLLEVKKKEDKWTTPKGKILNTERLEDILRELLTLKSNYILEKSSDTQKKQIQNLLTPPEFQLQIELTSGKSFSYKISRITENLADLVLNNEPHFLVIESNNPLIYVVKSKSINVFDIKQESLTDLEISN